MTAITSNSFECDGCGHTYDGTPERLAEGLPFRTYCSDSCALSDDVALGGVSL